jgi:hypothetical protein
MAVPKTTAEEIEKIKTSWTTERVKCRNDDECVKRLMETLPYSRSTILKYGRFNGRDRKRIVDLARDIMGGQIPREPQPSRPTLAETDDPDKIKELIDAERDSAKWKTKFDDLEKRYKIVSADRDDYKDQVDAIIQIKERIQPIRIKAPAVRRGADGEAVAVVVASDWHYGAIVRPNTVNFLNEVHPEITAMRIKKFFQAVVKLIKKEQTHVQINTLVLALIGDFIENYLHPELIEEATLSPIEQTQGVQELIIGGIEYILRETELDLVIPTCPGNHGRTTFKMQAGTNYKNSLEQLMYWNMAKYFASEPRVKFQISDSYFNYLDVYDHTLRFHHGDACKFNAGIGGLMIPLRKFIHRANQQVHADTSICGHFHSLLMDYDIIVNGSLVGPSAYSTRLGFPPERPQQVLRLLDAKRGWTVFAPILVAEQERKNGRIVG